MSTQVAEAPGDVQLGPGSTLWENAGRSYNLLVALPGGLLQLMNPPVGAGVAEWSRVFEDPGERLVKSIDPILGSIYAANPHAIGEEIRDIHREIRGTDEKGRSYHALNPKTFWWTLSSFGVMIADGRARYSGSGPFTPSEREQLHQETVGWYSRFGVTMRPVQPDFEAFQTDWDYTIEHELEKTQAAEEIANVFQEGDIDSILAAFNVHPLARKLGRKAMAEVIRLVGIGGLPETARELLEIPFSKKDERKLRLLDSTVRILSPHLAPEQFYLPVALEGMKRVSPRGLSKTYA